ncbi:type III restriction enzyme, res subunit [Caedimonas varicaedens]|uniref:Type III restriction enzyme, res subunit n=1 Tax=Caedimonas varicaedens TaxID=1629334 RepID=A0A0K8MAN0_9PROT|nr:type III restriction enzyme, res subunit [Caedimonas varicaedens]
MIFALKNYQLTVLKTLNSYLEAARAIGAKPAYDSMMQEADGKNPCLYQPLKGLERIPYICLRLPTGGGKTFLSAHTVKIASQSYLERDYPVALWLVPTNTIRTQTLQTLKKPGHPNYETLREAFNGRFKVIDISDFDTLTPTDLQGACIIVGTFASLRVTNTTEGRKVYDHHENLEAHFADFSGDNSILERKENGSILFSFRNVLAMHRPLVIVDEAHNHTSSLSVEVLKRINASSVVEFTATPPMNSNILCSISAAELKAEEMIKLPIRLISHNTWEEAVKESILMRQRLEDVARQEKDYIRPIVLFQAEEKNKDITQGVLLNHLLEQEKIPRHEIAIVTGTQKELDGINLLSPECPIKFVLTIEALKEGWDCSFAYVFCSVATIYSKKDVEQILGRVLRMPYARKRAHADLNRAYAYVCQSSWRDAAKQLCDALVDMGFEKNEVARFVDPQPSLFSENQHSAQDQSVVDLPEGVEPYIAPLILNEPHITLEQNGSRSRLLIRGHMNLSIQNDLMKALPTKELRETLSLNFDIHNKHYAERQSSAQKGIPFIVPRLYLHLEDDLRLMERDIFLEIGNWDLSHCSVEITEDDFCFTENGVQWEIDLNDQGHITHKSLGRAEQQELDLVDTGWTSEQLCRWLEKEVRQQDISQSEMFSYIKGSLQFLIEKRDIPLTALVRWRYVLSKVLKRKIDQHRFHCVERGYEQVLSASVSDVRLVGDFQFMPDQYHPSVTYVGYPYEFTKHYYAQIGKLENKGEEFDCAKALDLTAEIKYWVRNLDQQGFWLPLSTGKFYPDFIAELQDGRILIIEHKGKIYATNDDSKEKARIGHLWAEHSQGKGLFLMTIVEKNRPSLAEQIKRAITSTL